ncbi:hypothetical protein [Actinomadura sp. NTSP31]|uniref:hypothetical protein n=1 Tax=Actinomadura sp. NTSP31 TaxID=1735447 RepID=UPI0035BEB9DF
MSVALAGAAFTGAAAALLSWAAHPFDEATEDRFSAIVFGARGIAPIGYAVLAFTLGTVVGLLVRRTLPAMAVTGVAVCTASRSPAPPAPGSAASARSARRTAGR